LFLRSAILVLSSIFKNEKMESAKITGVTLGLVVLQLSGSNKPF
jgi:hypothetical protein